MPGTETILFGLAWIANQATWFAVLWHGLLGAALVAIVGGGWHPRRRDVILLSAPVVSVASLAWSTGNGFNALVFGLMAVGFVGMGVLAKDVPVTPGNAWATSLGAGALAFAWLYPHFLEGPALAYLVASPLGLLPCPTLAMIVGFGLWGHGFGSRAWTVLVGGVGVFYGAVGAFVLGVWIDVGLLVAALGLLATLRRAPVTEPLPA